MNSYSPTQTPVVFAADYTAPTIGGDWHAKNALADRHARYESAIRTRAEVVARLVAARDEFATAERNEASWRSRRVALSTHVAELVQGRDAADASIRASMPPVGAAPAAPVVHTASQIGPTLSQAMAAHVTPADQIAKAHGFADARAHMTSRLLSSLEAPARTALEADAVALASAVDLALAGKETEALAVASALARVEPKAKGAK